MSFTCFFLRKLTASAFCISRFILTVTLALQILSFGKGEELLSASISYTMHGYIIQFVITFTLYHFCSYHLVFFKATENQGADMTLEKTRTPSCKSITTKPNKSQHGMRWMTRIRAMRAERNGTLCQWCLSLV